MYFRIICDVVEQCNKPLPCDVEQCICSNVAQYKVWVKANMEQQFLYGHHIMKSGLGRITENTGQYQGVVVYSMNDLPLVSMAEYVSNVILQWIGWAGVFCLCQISVWQ